MHSYYNDLHFTPASLFSHNQSSPTSNSPNHSNLPLFSQPLSDYLEAVQFNCQGSYQKAIDSLLLSLQALHKETPDQTSYLTIKVLIELSRAKVGLADYKEAEEYLNKALEVVTESKSLTAEERELFYGEIELGHGDIDMERSLFTSALDNYKKSLKTFETVQQEKGLLMAICYRRIGEALVEQKLYFEALEYYEVASATIRKKEEDFSNEEYLEVIRILNRKGVLFANLQRYKEAVEMLTDCSIAIKGRFGPEHVELVWSYHHLGGIYLRICLYGKSKAMLEDCLDLERKIFPEKHPWIVKTCAEKARLLTDQEKSDEGETGFLKAVELAREIYGEESPGLGIYYLKLGYFYLEQEKYDEAEKLFKKVLSTYLKAYGENNGLSAIGYHTLAVTYQEMGKWKESQENYGKDLEICEKYYGEVHPEVSKSYYWLGIFYWIQEKREESLKYLKKCCEIDEKYYGKASPQVAIDYQELGRVIMELGDAEGSLEYYRKSSEIEKNYFGEKHPRIARSCFLVGIGLCDAGKWKEAKLMLEKSLMIADKSDLEAEFQVRRVYHALGNLFNNKGKYKEALRYYGKALSVGKDNQNNEELLRNLADVFYNQDKFEKALELYKKVLEITLKGKGCRHYAVGVLHTNIGNCLGWMKDQEGDAMKSLQKGIKVLMHAPYKDHKDLVVLLDNFYSRGDVLKRTKGARESVAVMKKAMVLCRISEKDKVKDLDKSIQELEKRKALGSNCFLKEDI